MDVAEAAVVDEKTLAKYEPVIGLEVHVQLQTESKLFSASSTAFGNPPNTQTDPVVLGLPGALPVLNREAVAKGIAAALALNCQIRRFSRFARKNYFYPDLPKGYQISQFDQPLAEHGWLDVPLDGGSKRVGVTRLHLEEDAGKTIHDGFPDSSLYSYVDLNRAGVPLAEIVSEPDIRGPEEAFAYLSELKQMMQFTGVSNCDMEKGQLRCDANVSVRLKGAEKLGTKVEIKNLNSFRFVRMGIEYEILRQIGVLEAGGEITQETRLFNTQTGETVPMRSKEHAHDYRYFPEPDLMPLIVSEEWESKIRQSMAELPAAKRGRFIEDYGLSEYDARVLTQNQETAHYFEAAAKVSGNPKIAANWVQGDLMGALNTAGKPISESPVSAEGLGELIKLLDNGTLSSKLAKDVFAKMFADGKTAAEVVESEGLKQISDEGALQEIIDDVLAKNAGQLETYRGGKTGLLGFFVGQVMKATRGQADPAVVNELLRKALG